MDVGTLSDISATQGTWGTTVFEFNVDPSWELEFAFCGVVARDVGYVSLLLFMRDVLVISISANFLDDSRSDYLPTLLLIIRRVY